MLDRLRIKNFRLLRDVEIEFEADRPTVFVGPNSSGKSTVLEVLRFISRCADDGLQAAVTAHGGFESIQTAGAKAPIEIETTWTTLSKKRPSTLVWTISLARARGGRTVVSRELLSRAFEGETKPLVVTADDGSRTGLPDRGSEGAPSAIPSSNQLAFEVLRDSQRFLGLSMLWALSSSVSVIGGLASAPAWARMDPSGPSPRDSLVIAPKEFLDPQGLGLANVLYSLFTDSAAAWKELETAFYSEFPFVERLMFPADPGGSKIAFAVEDRRFPGRKVYASEMSDGMITYLCLLAAIVHPDQMGLLGLDEPDANLHPSALRRLLSIAHGRHPLKRNIAIVTHSNALLDELRDPAQSIRIVEPTKDGAAIRRLDPDALDAWRKEYSLSGLRSTGLLDPPNAAYGSG